MKVFSYVFFIFILFSCGSDEQGNTRAYVEGKVIAENFDADDVFISMHSENRTVAQTIPQPSGNFVLSGPLFSDGFTLKFSKKIKTFSATKPNCEISADSLSIAVPKNVSFLTFDQITLQK